MSSPAAALADSAAWSLPHETDNHDVFVEQETLVNGIDHDDNDQVFSEEFDTLSLTHDDELDMFTCHLCREEIKQPRVLSCLHSFCEGCLKPLLVEDSICCPRCQTVSYR